MDDDTFNRAVDLWNSGQNLGEIAQALGVGIYQLHPISRAAAREAMRMNAAGEDENTPVRLTRR